MMRRVCFLLLQAILFLGIDHVSAQGGWNSISDTMQRYGAPLTFMADDSVRAWFIEHMNTVGYKQCYEDFYNQLCNAENLSRQRDDSLQYDLGMSRLFMAWQSRKISANSAFTKMQRLMNECERRYGNKTRYYQTLTLIMAEFHNANGNFDAADSCYHRVIHFDEYDIVVYNSQYAMALHAKMVADIGRGRLSEAWKTARKIMNRSNFDGIPQYDKELDIQQLSPAATKTSARLAQQMGTPLFPPSMQVVLHQAFEPWPLEVKGRMFSNKNWNMPAVFQLYELLFQLRLSRDWDNFLYRKIVELGYAPNKYEYADFLSQELLTEMHRRSACIASEHAERLDTLTHPHNKQSNEIIRRWGNCFATEQLNGGERSAVPLLKFSTEWIKKGYPLAVLPLIEEAVSVMQRDFACQHPTMKQLLSRRHDREWLNQDFPKLLPLVETIPEYAKVIADFKALAKESRRETF